jgi:hypothetical protein
MEPLPPAPRRELCSPDAYVIVMVLTGCFLLVTLSYAVREPVFLIFSFISGIVIFLLWGGVRTTKPACAGFIDDAPFPLRGGG